MKPDKNNPAESKTLRGRADRVLEKRGGSADVKLKNTTALKQLHELQVHQVELEMQNRELRKIRAKLDASLARYTALYDFAPVGYLTLGSDSTIVELNAAAAHLLGQSRSPLIGRRLGAFVTLDCRPVFNEYLASMLQGHAAEDCEIELLRDTGATFFVHVTAVKEGSGQTCLVALTDVTPRREMVRKLRETEHFAQGLLQQNRQLTRRMFQMLESDRRNIAHEIHDELGQWITAIQSETGAIIQTESKLQPRTRTAVRTINASVAEMHNVLRHILLRLRPTMLDTVGLTESLRELTSQWRERQKSTRCELTLNGKLNGLGESLNITIFRIIQEALTNIAKHAHASKVDIVLESLTKQSGSGEVLLTIQDDGQGFDPAVMSQGLGLPGMRERTIAAEGDFELSSEPGHGVHIEVRLPISPAPMR